MRKRMIGAVLCMAIGLWSCSMALGAAGIVVPGRGSNMEEQKDQTLRFVAEQEMNLYGKKRTVAVFSQINGSGDIRTLVGGKDPRDPDPDIQTTVEKLQKGDVVKMNLAEWNGNKVINYIKKIEVKPAEETPHGFVFEEFYNQQDTGAPLVRVTKYGESYELTLPMVKNDKGEMVFDPQLIDAVQKLKSNEAVYLQGIRGNPPIVTEIYPFPDIQNGKVSKVAQEKVEGGKTSAIEIETSDGKTVTALVPGKMRSKYFVADSTLLRQVQLMKPGTQVQFMTRDENGATYLVEVTRAPKPSTSSGSSLSNAAGSMR